ncbi:MULTISPECIES: hypothetical protein [Streptomyces]|nr:MULTISPECIES: hypothetical protein [Streptomyces]MCX5307847.1 hypothetical protein [Streptomyces sp. NBC_00160]
MPLPPPPPDKHGVAKAFARSCLTAVAVILLLFIWVFSRGQWI